MPVYNAEAFLRESIDSILNQSFAEFEFLIINDGSTDQSETIIKSYTDKRIRLINNDTNLKLITTLNKGIELAKGEYIARMDADDISHPDRLKKQFEFLESHPEIGICGTWFESIGQNKSVLKYPQDDTMIRIKMLYQCPFCHPSVMIRKTILAENNLKYNPNFAHAEDYELWTQLSRFTKFANIPEVLLKYRLHEANVSNKHSKEQRINTQIIIQNQFQLLGINLSEREYLLYLKIAYSDFNFSLPELMEAEKLLSALSSNNEKLKIISIHEFNVYLSERWYSICTNSSVLGTVVLKIYFKAKLAKIHNLSLPEKLKFFIKCLIRKGS